MADEIEPLETEGAGTISSLVDDVFTDPTTEPDEGSQGETEATEAEPAAETTEAASPAVEDKSKKDIGLEAALLAERRKRQEAEEKLRERETKKAPDPIEDPEGYANHVEARAQQNEFKTRIAISRDLMKDAHQDFEEVEKVFMGLIADDEGNIIDESLLRKFQSAPNPARFAYQHAKEHLEVQEIRSPTYREKLKAEIRAELEAELNGKKGVSATQVPDLTKATASGSNSTPVERLPELDEIFKDSKL